MITGTKAAASALLFVLAACTAAPMIPNVPLLVQANGDPSGSCVIIAPGWGLTAKHVLPVLTARNFGLVGPIILHPRLDLALIQIRGARGEVPIADKAPEFGDALRALGWHLGRMALITEGRQGLQPGTMSCPISPGCSGGAVYNTAGELVGVIRQVSLIAVQDMINGGRTPYAAPVPHMAGYTLLTPEVQDWIRAATR